MQLSLKIGYTLSNEKRPSPFRPTFLGFSRAGQQPASAEGMDWAIRDALGMTTAQFARRLKIAQPSAVELEQSEAANRITLRTLERAAEALGCRLVYALIPAQPLEETVRNRAKLMAGRKLAAVEHSMRLEDQAVRGKKRKTNSCAK